MADLTVDRMKALDASLIGEAIKLRFFPITVARGVGARVYDVEGRAYLDFTAGW